LLRDGGRFAGRWRTGRPPAGESDEGGPAYQARIRGNTQLSKNRKLNIEIKFFTFFPKEGR
jgi:hypothetical protein